MTVTLYIYRVEWTYPARNLIYRYKSIKTLVVLGLYLDRSDRSDLSVRPCRTGHSASTGQTGWCQFWLSTELHQKYINLTELLKHVYHYETEKFTLLPKILAKCVLVPSTFPSGSCYTSRAR